MSKIVNNFFKKVNAKSTKGFEMSRSKNIICEAFDISCGSVKAPVILILNKVTADVNVMFPTTGESWSGNIYDVSHELKTVKTDTYIESELKGYIYKEILKRYRFMFDAKSIEKVHLNYDRTF